MSRFLISWLAIACMGLSGAETTRSIQVVGTAEAKVVPDVAHVSVGARQEAQTVKQAMEKLEKSFRALEELVSESGIAAKDVQTEAFQVQPRYRFDEGKRNLTGYEARKMLRVTFRDFDRLKSFLHKALSTGPNELGGLQFEFSRMDSLKTAVTLRALQEAKKTASRMAAELGVKTTNVLHATNTEPGVSFIGPHHLADVGRERMMMQKEAFSEELFQIHPGTITVSAQSTVTFGIQ